MGEMSHVKTRNLPHIGQICSQYAGGHEKGVMGESSRFTHNPFWLRSLKVSFCACSSFGSSCRPRRNSNSSCRSRRPCVPLRS